MSARAQWSVVAVLGTAAGCNGCGHTSRDAAADVPVVDAPPQDTLVPRDMGLSRTDGDASPDAPSLWSNGSVDLRSGPRVPRPAGACGDARRLTPGSYTAAQGVFTHGGWLYLSGQNLARVDLTTFATEQIGRTDADIGIWGAPLGSGVAVAFYDRTRRATALAAFDALPGRGHIIWDPLGPPPLPGAGASGGGIMELVGSEAFVAWTWQRGEGGLALWVAGSRGENARELPLPSGAVPHYLHASGPRLVFDVGEDIWLWDARTGDAPENLTNDPRDQWHPWLDGDRLVWVDQRDTPAGGLWSPNNPEIYTMDLRTRVAERLTHDPPERPVVQHAPVVRGDWVVWMDFRNAEQPNPSQFLTDRMELWGYHLPTRREVPIVTGQIQAYYPALINGQVVFPCVGPDRLGGVFMAPLPSVD